jgi:tryptophan synthase beta chain
VIGREARAQILAKEDCLPDYLAACVGGGSNAMGLFYAFLNDKNVKKIGVEAAGEGIESGKHCATLTLGTAGIFQGMKTYLLQSDEGQISEVHSISAGLDYPGVGPEHSFLKDMEDAEYYSVTDQEALDAAVKLSRLEGILPALETSHALAYLEYLMPETSKNEIVIVNISGRGDKDLNTIMDNMDEKITAA